MNVDSVAPPWSRRREILRRVAGRQPADELLTKWHRWATRQDDVFFVQIGSNDGFRSDPLAYHLERQPRWRGLLVEPVPTTFAELAKRRDESRFELVQAAVTDHDGSVTIYVVDSQDGVASLLSSLRPDVVERYRDLVADFELRPVVVPAMTFATLTSHLVDIDVLHIDAEGHDATILDQVDLDRWSLRAVLYECLNLTDADKRRCATRLVDHGFELCTNGHDVLALR